MGLKEFNEKIHQDKEFAAKFRDLRTLEDLVAAAAKEGFTFTVDDIKKQTELTDDELDRASGRGQWHTPIPASWEWYLR